MGNIQTMQNRTYRSSGRNASGTRTEQARRNTNASYRTPQSVRRMDLTAAEHRSGGPQNVSTRSGRPQNVSGRGGRSQNVSGRSGRSQSVSTRSGNSRRTEWEYYEEYIDGNTVRKTQLETLLEEDPKKQLHQRARKNREKAVHMNFGYVAFLVGALVLMGIILISYINLRSEITSSINRISQMESELYSLQQENDEYETRINSSVNLEDVRRIAIEELGMKYASEGQIINVEGGSDDYVRKYAEIP